MLFLCFPLRDLIVEYLTKKRQFEVAFEVIPTSSLKVVACETILSKSVAVVWFSRIPMSWSIGDWSPITPSEVAFHILVSRIQPYHIA